MSFKYLKNMLIMINKFNYIIFIIGYSLLIKYRCIIINCLQYFINLNCISKKCNVFYNIKTVGTLLELSCSLNKTHLACKKIYQSSSKIKLSPCVCLFIGLNYLFLKL